MDVRGRRWLVALVLVACGPDVDDAESSDGTDGTSGTGDSPEDPAELALVEVVDEFTEHIRLGSLEGNRGQMLSDRGYSPSWSPDGLRLAVASDYAIVYLLDAETVTEPQVFGLGGHGVGSPQWSPSGLDIAFVAAEQTGPVMTIQSVDEGSPSYRADGAAPSWSPSGDQLVFVSIADGMSHVAIYELATDQVTSVLSAGMGRIASTRWDPAGAWIAFVSGESPERAVELIRPDGGEVVPVTEAGEDAWGPSWSPSGDRLAFWSGAPGDATLAWVRVADGDRTEVAEGLDGSGAVWTLDGEQILYVADGSGVNIVPADGSAEPQELFAGVIGVAMRPERP